MMINNTLIIQETIGKVASEIESAKSKLMLLKKVFPGLSNLYDNNSNSTKQKGTVIKFSILF